MRENTQSSMDIFLNEYTSEDTKEVFTNAILFGPGTILYDPDAKEALEFYEGNEILPNSSWSYLAFTDILSEILKDGGHEVASKYIA